MSEKGLPRNRLIQDDAFSTASSTTSLSVDLLALLLPRPSYRFFWSFHHRSPKSSLLLTKPKPEIVSLSFCNRLWLHAFFFPVRFLHAPPAATNSIDDFEAPKEPKKSGKI
ncbi:unnamed protein product [Lactuca virosa]|uniref:Uncharacterized protein n=1 Tax=Lactuca virosa TaxID=75947 RepID=A0AAU9MAP7_9ASTR|nr:unnamed protein product [Lactuca virosa]